MELSTKELIYAAAVLGADHFWGIPDPFYGEGAQELKKSRVELPKSLASKGYARIGFEDSFKLTEECSKLVGDCCFCEQILGLEIYQSSKVPMHLLCYRKGDVFSLMYCDGDLVQLEESTGEGLLKQYEEALAWEQDVEPVRVENMVLVKLIEEAKAKDNATQAVELLTQKGVSKEIAEIIGETIIGRVRTIRFYLHDIAARTKDAQLLLWTEKGVLEIVENLEEMEETWMLRTISKEDVIQFMEQKYQIFMEKEATGA